MNRIKVQIVDDSAVMRQVLRQALSADPEIQVVGTAANGRIGLAQFAQVRPDLVTLDIEMPEMDGLAMLKELRRSNPKVPVVMFSYLTERGASVTFDALALGASDYVCKPARTANRADAISIVGQQLIPRIKALCCPKEKVEKVSLPSIHLRGTPFPASVELDVVAIGTSTGGPNALARVLPSIPADFPVPVLIVQHMPPPFTRFLAERLSAICKIPVREASPNRVPKPGEAWIAPGDFHMKVHREGTQVRIHLSHDAPENFCRPAVDVLFRSVAQAYGTHSMAVVLTGMGRDGLLGAIEIHNAGGVILAQDENTSVVWGMPGFVARAGIAERILPLDDIGKEIVKTVLLHQKKALPHQVSR